MDNRVSGGGELARCFYIILVFRTGSLDVCELEQRTKVLLLLCHLSSAFH